MHLTRKVAVRACSPAPLFTRGILMRESRFVFAVFLAIFWLFSAIAGSPQTTTPPLGHVVIVAMENHSYSDVVGSSAMPYYNGLISQYGLAQKFYANVHGSFPNYAMLTTGELITQAGWGLPSDFPISIDNLVRELTAAGKTWKAYAENLPSVGYTGGDVYPYLKRHNPFAFISDVLNDTAQANHIVPFAQFATDVAGNTLPDFSFVIPNAADDSEDCPGGATATCLDSDKLANADQWLQTNIAPLLSSSAFQQNGLLVIWWDEGNAADTANGGGNVAVTLAGPLIKPGFRSTTFYRHENVLRTIAEGLGIGFPGASIYVRSMSEFFGASITPGSITGHVTDSSSGAAISGALVSYGGGSTTTDSTGAYALSNVPAGTYTVTASQTGYANQSKSIQVTAGATATLDFQLTATTTGSGAITGKVTNVSTGGAIAGSTVTYSGGSATTDTNGNYILSNVAAGTYNVTATRTGYISETKSATVASGATTTLNFAMATGGKIAGTVTSSAGAAIAGATVHISGGAVTTTLNVTTSSTGSYNSGWIPIGTYTVTVSANGFTTQTQSAAVTTGNTTTLNFKLQ
jgi:phosphatidylinositol-3-phosphatase